MGSAASPSGANHATASTVDSSISRCSSTKARSRWPGAGRPREGAVRGPGDPSRRGRRARRGSTRPSRQRQVHAASAARVGCRHRGRSGHGNGRRAHHVPRLAQHVQTDSTRRPAAQPRHMVVRALGFTISPPPVAGHAARPRPRDPPARCPQRDARCFRGRLPRARPIVEGLARSARARASRQPGRLLVPLAGLQPATLDAGIASTPGAYRAARRPASAWLLTVYSPARWREIWAELQNSPQLEVLRSPYFLALLVEQVEATGGDAGGARGVVHRFRAAGAATGDRARQRALRAGRAAGGPRPQAGGALALEHTLRLAGAGRAAAEAGGPGARDARTGGPPGRARRFVSRWTPRWT